MSRRKVALALMVAGFTLLSGCACRERVDPGNVGILIDYTKKDASGDPSSEYVSPASYVWVDQITQRLVSYPDKELTLSMVQKAGEGQVRDDDAVLCQAKGGASLSIDVSATWQVVREKAHKLYFLRPGESLEGDINKSIEGSVVRPAVRNALNLACSKYAPIDIMADKKYEVQEEAESVARQALLEQYITLKKLELRGAHPPKELEASISQVTAAQQKAEAAKQEVNQAYAQATSSAIRRTALTVEEQQRQDIINKWDGHLPLVVGSDGKTPINLDDLKK